MNARPLNVPGDRKLMIRLQVLTLVSSHGIYMEKQKPIDNDDDDNCNKSSSVQNAARAIETNTRHG